GRSSWRMVRFPWWRPADPIRLRAAAANRMSALDGSGAARPGRPARPMGIAPGLRSQWRQPVGLAGPVTLGARLPVLPGRLQLPARRGALGVDAAMRVGPDGAFQCRAAWVRAATGAAHRDPVRIQLLGQRSGRGPAHERLALGPVEGDAEVGAAGAAGKAGMIGHGAGAGGGSGQGGGSVRRPAALLVLLPAAARARVVAARCGSSFSVSEAGVDPPMKGSLSDQWKATRKWAQQAPQARQG